MTEAAGEESMRDVLEMTLIWYLMGLPPGRAIFPSDVRRVAEAALLGRVVTPATRRGRPRMAQTMLLSLLGMTRRP